MLSNGCFNCLNHGKGEGASNNGWYHLCKLNILNEGLHDVESCPKYEPNKGFQMGGYYTFTHFEKDGEDCLDLIIHGNGEFPRGEEDKDEWIKIHICEFEQIEHWVRFWGEELRKRGWVNKITE